MAYEDDYRTKLADEQKGQAANMCNQALGYEARPKTTEEKVSDIFTYHNDPSKIPNYNAIRSTAKHLAMVIIDNSPAGQDQALALLYLRQAVMFANAAIALNGRML
jgi:hypothetical protein